MKKALIISILVLMGCSSEDDFQKGKRQLELQGYTNIESTGYDWFCCSDKDTYSTGFKAMAKDSTIVEGCICSGVFKGVTIRFK